jgi:hypothetical protein
MTSVLSSFGQIQSQSKYFLAFSTNSAPISTSTNPSDPTIAAFTLAGMLGTLSPGDISTDDIITGISTYSTAQVSMGTLYRDLGRKVNIYNNIGVNPNLNSSTYLMAVYRQMQIVSGPQAEGNPAYDSTGEYPTVYVKVWQAADSKPNLSVCVARTG